MGNEMEVKVLNINKEEIIKKLEALGARLVKEEYQINTIFDDQNRRIKNTYNGYLRIRETKNLLENHTDYILTLKKNISKDAIRKNVEIETRVNDKEALTEILKHFDVKVKHEGTKERISYEYDNILFEIDTWDKETYPETYLEIEVNKEEDLSKAIKILNLDKRNVTSKSLGELRMEKGLEDL